MEQTRKKELSGFIKKAGGVVRVSKLLGITPTGLYDSINRGDLAPRHAPIIEKATQGLVRCEDLCRGIDWKSVRETACKDFAQNMAESIYRDK